MPVTVCGDGVGSLIVGALVLFNSPNVPSFQRVSVPLIVGVSIAEIQDIGRIMRAMLKEEGPPPEGRWADLALLEPVRPYKSRHASTLLVFEAIDSNSRMLIFSQFKGNWKRSLIYYWLAGLVVMGLLEQRQGQGTFVRSAESREQSLIATMVETQAAYRWGYDVQADGIIRWRVDLAGIDVEFDGRKRTDGGFR